jgi:hypothetical protein
LKQGCPKSSIGGAIMPAGSLITDQHTNQQLFIGELYALTVDGIRLRWYYDSAGTSCTEYGASGAEIDYIIFKPAK